MHILSNQDLCDRLRWNIKKSRLLVIVIVVLLGYWAEAQYPPDSAGHLKKVTVVGFLRLPRFTSSTPIQVLNKETLHEINAESVGDAAKYFAGVLIKDYGGIGGLKTISVRSLGADNTSVLYDGIMIADAQSGQLDISKFSASLVQSLELYQINTGQLLLPARNYSAGSILAIQTSSFLPDADSLKKWQARVKQGSFGLWQSSIGVFIPTAKKWTISASAESTSAKGNYPFQIDNGRFSQQTRRINSDIQSLQAELNATKTFGDNSFLQIKAWGYQSDRGLPGSIIFYNNISVQRLWDHDMFVQTRYQKNINRHSTILISGKYSFLLTRYADPNFLNNSGGLDDKYKQHEIYGSFSITHRFSEPISVAFSSDIASTHLGSNIVSFATPSRINSWNNIAIQYQKSRWKLNASLLNTYIKDMSVSGPASTSKNKFTWTAAASYQPGQTTPWIFRVLYKDIFRMPSFNDLYYTYTRAINPKLLPEYLKQVDAGFIYTKRYDGWLSRCTMTIDAYYNTIQNKIVAVPSQNLFLWTIINLGKVHVKGVDVSTEITGYLWSSMKWLGRLTYTWQRALDFTTPGSASYRNELPYTPDNSGSGILAITKSNWTTGYNVLFSSRRFSIGQNNKDNRLAGWMIQDLYLARTVRGRQVATTLRAEIDNMFNEQYSIIKYYPMPGRAYKLSLTFTNP